MLRCRQYVAHRSCGSQKMPTVVTALMQGLTMSCNASLMCTIRSSAVEGAMCNTERNVMHERRVRPRPNPNFRLSSCPGGFALLLPRLRIKYDISNVRHLTSRHTFFSAFGDKTATSDHRYQTDKPGGALHVCIKIVYPTAELRFLRAI